MPMNAWSHWWAGLVVGLAALALPKAAAAQDPRACEAARLAHRQIAGCAQAPGRQQQPNTRRRRTTRVAPPPPPVRRYREPIVRAHQLMIRNACPVALEVRLIYRTSRGFEQLPNGQVWTIPAGSTAGPLNDVQGRQLAVTDDELYHHATDPTGAWTFTHPLSRSYNGTPMAVAQNFATIDAYDRYVVEFTCRASTPPPPPPPPPPSTRGLVIRNECSDRLEIRLIYRTPSGYEQPRGEVWNVAGRTNSAPLRHRGELLRLVSNEVYYQVNGPSGPWPIERAFDADYNGTPLRMGQLLALIGPDGNYYIRFTC